MKTYRFYGLNTAIDFLRPNAKYQSDGMKFLSWDDERPCPEWQEVLDTLEKIKQFEDSINTVWTQEQLNMLNTLGNIINLNCIDGFHQFREVTAEDLIELQNNNKI